MHSIIWLFTTGRFDSGWVQSVASVALVLLTILTLFFLNRYVRDTKTLAVNSLEQINAAMTPILVLIANSSRSTQELNDALDCSIENQGPGAAQNVMWYYAEPVLTPVCEPISTTLIGSRCTARITVNHDKLSSPGVAISYESLDGRRFKTAVKLVKGVMTQSHTPDYQPNPNIKEHRRRTRAM